MGKNFVVGNFAGDIYRARPEYRSWNLTSCCGFEAQNPTQALMSVKCPGNTFDLNPKWTRTLPVGILHGRYIEHTLSLYRSWTLTPYCELEVENLTQALSTCGVSQKVCPWPIADWSAWVRFCAWSLQQDVNIQLRDWEGMISIYISLVQFQKAMFLRILVSCQKYCLDLQLK